MPRHQRRAARFDGLTIDVSSNNGEIDWQRVKAAGVNTAILRATMGGAGVDTRFHEYIAAARLAGVHTGFYHLFRPDSDGIPQARHFIRSTEGSAEGVFGVILAVDVERVIAPQRELTKAQYADELRAFLEHLDQETNTPVVIYTSAGEWNALVGAQHDAFFGKFPLWVANYTLGEKPFLPRCWTEYLLWQYSSSGSVDGIQGRVDLNRPPPAPFTLLHPVKAPEGCRIVISSHFGVPRDYDGDGIFDDRHEGVDFAPVGNACLPEIVACADGVVESVSTLGAYGNRITIRHAHGSDVYYTWYAHLSRLDVSRGEIVLRGQVIGVMGSTGNSTGVHLHLNLQHLGHGLSGFVLPDVVNPAPFIVTS